MSSDLHSAPQPLRSLQGPAFFAKVGWPDSARLLRLFDALRSDDAAVVSASIAEDGFTCTRLDELSDESSSAPALTAGLFASPAALSEECTCMLGKASPRGFRGLLPFPGRVPGAWGGIPGSWGRGWIEHRTPGHSSD